MRESIGLGPQVHERAARPSVTGLSLRSQTRWKAGSVCAAAAAAGPAGPANPAANRARVSISVLHHLYFSNMANLLTGMHHKECRCRHEPASGLGLSTRVNGLGGAG